MKRSFVLGLALFFMLAFVNAGSAWKYNTHKSSVIHAMNYMGSGNADSVQQWAAQFLKYMGGEDIAEQMGIKNGDTDDFKDTSVGGWWVGYRTNVSLFGFDTNFTSYWHFLTMFRPGHYGNAYDGYSYKYSPDDGFWGYNGLVKSLLYNQDVKNKDKAGRTISNPENGQGVRDGYKYRYQLSSSQKYYSTTPGSNYDDYQNIIFEPNSNAAVYWYFKALYGRVSSNIDRGHMLYLGHVMHMAGDANVTQHIWDTLDHYHTSYEGWVDENYYSLYNPGKVKELIDGFMAAYNIQNPSQLSNITLQEIFAYFAARSLNMPAPLYSEDYGVRYSNGYEQYNGSVAINVIIMEKYVYDLYIPESARKF